MSENNIALWNRHQKPHKDALKAFKRGGGFSGTAIDPMWVIREATLEWGPAGSGWGYRVINEDYVTGAPMKDGGNEILHVVRVEIWYTADNGEVAKIEAYGHTMFVGSNKHGPFTDEEAPKKSLTDAVCKGLSWLGFGSAVHMGMFDGNKYVDLRGDAKPDAGGKEPRPAPPKKEKEEPKKKPDAVARIRKYLDKNEQLVGHDATEDSWVTLLRRNPEHSKGNLSLGDMLNDRNVTFTNLWKISDLVEEMYNSTVNVVEAENNQEPEKEDE